LELADLTAHEIHRLLLSGEVTAEEVLSAVKRKCDKLEPLLNSYISFDWDGAYEQARRVDQKLRAGEEIGTLEGIPVAVKDCLCTAGGKTTAGSKILENFISPYDATTVERLRRAGLVMVGKANLDEFTMGSSNETSYFGVVSNPWDIERVPGGSSGGSCAAVAAGEAIVALGTDTGGSIRQPASFTGVVGLKPTYGRVSRYGLIAHGSSLDQVGPIARDVEDVAALFQVIAGHDPRDSTSATVPVPKVEFDLDSLKGCRLGIPGEYLGEGLDGEVKSAFEDTVKQFERLGAEIKEISLPHTEYAIATYYIIATAEASSNLARYDGAHYGYRSESVENLEGMYSISRSRGFGVEVKRRIMLGTYVLSAGYYDAYYRKAQKVRTLIKDDFARAFSEVDMIVTPVSPTPAFLKGEKTKDPLAMYLADIYTTPVSLAGLPGLVVPCGFSANNLPIGIQLVGNYFSEGELLRRAYLYQHVGGLMTWNMRA